MSGSEKQALIFDGDDTLWKTQQLYRQAESAFRDRMTSWVGVSPEAAQAKFDQTNTALSSTMGFLQERYPLAMEQTYMFFVNQRGGVPDPQQVQIIRAIGESVFTSTPEPLEGVHEVLALLAQSYDLIFYSGGDENVQLARLERLDLARFFAGRIRVVPEKGQRQLQEIMSEFSLAKQDTWVIGNSPRYDINPALREGVHAIWVYSELWDNEKEDFTTISDQGNAVTYTTVFSLGEIPGKLAEIPRNRIPQKDLIDAQISLYSTVIEDQSHVSTRRQSLTTIFIGLNTVALSGIAFLVTLVHLDGSLYLDLVAGIIISAAAYFVNRIFRKAVTKYDHLITVYAIALRMIENSLRDVLLIRFLPGNKGHASYYEGLMNEIGMLRDLDSATPKGFLLWIRGFFLWRWIKRFLLSLWRWTKGAVFWRWIKRLSLSLWRWMWGIENTRSHLLPTLQRSLNMPANEVQEIAEHVHYSVEANLAALFVRFFRYTALLLVLIGILFAFGILQTMLPIVFPNVPYVPPLHDWYLHILKQIGINS